MLELNSWFFILLAQFCALLIILNWILFKPFIKIFNERKNHVDGDLQAAKEMDEKKETSLADVKREFQGARDKAKVAFETIRNEGLETQRALTSKAASEAMSLSEKAKSELKAEADKARTALRADVDRLADEIMEKLVKI